MRSLAIALVLVTACSGEKPPDVDAHPGGPLCSKQIYDLCTAEHDCMSALCQNFGGVQVCSQTCSPGGTPCPTDKSGAAGVCDNGMCKPSAPNMCHL